MSIAKAAELMREREAEERTRRVDRAIITNAVGDLAARAAVAKSRFELAASGEKQWTTAVKLAGVIMELDAAEVKIRRLPPVEQVTKHQTVLAQIAALTNDAYQSLLRHDAVTREFGGFVGDPVRLAGAIAGVDSRAKPKAKRSTKGTDRSFIANVFDRRVKARKKTTSTPATLKMIKTKSANGRPKISGTASSDAPDLSADYFSVKCLKRFEKEIVGLTVWAMHEYDPRTDAVGKVVSSVLTRRGSLHELDVEIQTASTPAAEAIVKLIQEDVRVGLSVGVYVEEQAPDPDNKSLTRIDDARIVDLSCVGLPANWQSGWVRTVE